MGSRLFLPIVLAVLAVAYSSSAASDPHPAALVGEWRGPKTGFRLQLWANGHVGPCGIRSQSRWSVDKPGHIHFALDLVDRDATYSISTAGELVMDGDDLLTGRYQRVGTLTVCPERGH
jgi:hypothetical protein